MSEIHSCSYYCTRPACVLAQRDEMRDKLMEQAEPVQAAVGWLCSPDGDFKRNLLYRVEFPPQSIAWQVPVYFAPQQQAEPVVAVQSAVLIEREACAKLCESTTASWTQHLYNEGCIDCAKAIRARGKQHAQSGQDRAQ